ncbi:serine/threonine-protein kinase [Streptomyces sp. CC228A]|uniref:serine/threonine-protein kinase n=1 Tax=Streptomyces sp. CC228A TaxID=2898186 RepID=UPI001F286D25|nr:serine/threonine-protein kinase [Streptomyces sp. CC228A]
MSMSESGRPVVDGRFELVSRLGSGGMGTVWRARDLALDREVALKEVRPPDPAAEQATPGLTAQLRERAVREARALARLSNRHVVTIHHIVEPADGAHPWIVMELVEGRSVYDRLTDGPMPVDEVVRLGLQVLSALRAAHAAGIQHRDVKPANVLLRPDGSAVLTDFGIAAMQDATTRLTSTGDLIGSPEFIAPERIRGEEGNPASDLWSLGMLLYVAAEGHHPLRRATNLATLVAVLDDPLPAPVRSGVLAPVLTRVLQRDPALRPDGAELERLLRAAAGQAEAAPAAPAPTAPLPAGQARPPRPPERRRRAPSRRAGPGGRTPTPPTRPRPPYRSRPRGPRARARTPPPCTTAPPRAPSARRSRRGTSAAAPPRRGRARLGGRRGAGRRRRGVRAARRRHGRRRTGGSRPGATAATEGGAGKAGAGPAAADTGSTPAAAAAGAPAVRGSLLTTANVRAVLAAFREASGSAQVTELTVYEDYALASIPTAPGARTYDAYEFRGGAARRTGPGGTISSDSADEQPFDVAALAWDRLPDLMKQAERDLGVDDPTMRYVIVDRWTFNGDEPTMRFYLTNEYRASGYLAADRTGKVVATHPSS